MDLAIRFDRCNLRVLLERVELGGFNRDGEADEDDRIILVLDGRT